jgi:hypothetical protein
VALGVVAGQAFEAALGADEVGAVGVAVVVEPVGEDEARGVVLGRLLDGAEEGPLLVALGRGEVRSGHRWVRGLNSFVDCRCVKGAEQRQQQGRGKNPFSTLLPVAH